MKKILVAMLLSALAIAPLAQATTGDSGYTDDASKAPTLTAYISDTGGVDLNWDEASADGFVYYKVLRSQDNPDMVYPDNGYIAYMTDINDNYYYDTDFPSGTNHYRICTVFDGNVRGCSNTVTLELGTADDTSTDETEDPIYVNDDSFASVLSLTEDGVLASFTWTEYTGANFKWYKLVKSQETETPNYPENELVVYFDDASELAYSDGHIEAGTTYYRLCTITTDDIKACSNTITVENGEAVNEETETSESTDEYTDNESLAPTLSAELNDEAKVELTWTETASDNFVYYKVLRSNDNPDMVYPDDGYIKVISNLTTTKYTDAEYVDGTNYYRVCAIYNNKVRGCSNTVTLEELEALEKEELTETANKEYNYSDIKDHWGQTYIAHLAAKDIIDGTKVEFRPNDNITRAEAIKIIVLAAGLDEEECDTELFPDADANDWFCGFATKAHSKGYVNGVNGYLNPNAPITRAEAIKIVLVAKSIQIEEAIESVFPDVEMNAWYLDYTVKAKKLGIMVGKKGNDGVYYFEPNSPITRAELVKIVDKTFFDS